MKHRPTWEAPLRHDT